MVGKRERPCQLSFRCLSVRSHSHFGQVDTSGTEPIPIELKLERRAGEGEHGAGETLDIAKITARARQHGQTYARTFRSAIDGSLQYYAVVPALPGPSQGARPGSF